MSAKRKLDLDEQKIRVIQAAQGLNLLPKRSLYMEYFDMTEEEADRTIAEMKKEQEGEMEMQAQQQALTGEAEAQVDAIKEPTSESVQNPVEFMLNRTIDQEEKEIMTRIVEKQKQKAEELL